MRDETLRFLGYGNRVEREMTESAELLTPIELALYKRDFNLFQILFHWTSKHSNQFFLYKVIMRNLEPILAEKLLHKTIAPFFEDEGEQIYDITFGQKLDVDFLPDYFSEPYFCGF